MASSRVREGEATFNGVHIAFEVTGSDEAPALVFLHAGIADRRMWDGQMGAFDGWRTVRYDLRGFGRSSDAVGEFSHRADLVGLLDDLGISRAVLVGCSFGGQTALDVALEYPARVRALVLVSARPSGSQPSEELRRVWDAEDAALARGDLDAANEVGLRAWVDGPSRGPDEVDAPVRASVRTLNREVLVRETQASDAAPQPLDPPAIERLDDIRIPTLVIVGELDREDVRDAGRLLDSTIPNARLVTVPHTAHMVNLETPGRFNADVAGFLDGLTTE